MNDLPLATLGARLDHTAVAGPSMAPLVALYRDTLGGVFSHGEVLGIGAVVLTYVFGGSRVELMAPTPGSTFLDGFLAGTGGRGGVHHPVWSEVFVHPRSNGGVLLQLAQFDDYTAHVRHDEDALVAEAL